MGKTVAMNRLARRPVWARVHTDRAPSHGAPRRATACVILAASWYASLAAHESGHAIAGFLTGASTVRTYLPFLGFSRTDLTGDLHPRITTGAGIACGSVFPLLIWLTAAALRAPGRAVLAFWAGFALVLNGAYLAGDAIVRGGDGAVLVREGAPPWLLVVLGLPSLACGLWIWHGLGRRSPSLPLHARANLVTALALLTCALAAVALF